MIFATCGSSHLPFRRMMEALSALPAGQLQVQHGPADPPPCAIATRYLPFAQMVEKIDQADIIVSHAGVGSIMCAIRAGHTPIVLPRLRRYAETVDDHQAELAEALAARGVALIAWTAAELPEAVASVPERRTGTELGSQALAEAVRRAIHGRFPVRALPQALSGI